MKFKKMCLMGVAILAPVMALAAPANYSPVTDARLKNPEPSNWLMYRGNYAGWGYSSLKQVSDKNVKDLSVAWSFTTGLQEGHQSPPIVNNGYMYVTTPGSQVIALDAKTGGGGTWVTGVYDPETNLTFWGTGNPGPWPTEGRKGDNLYTTSVIALDVDSGKLKGHHQYHWMDGWDWDEVSAPVLIDTKVGGKNVKTAVHAGRNGYLWVLERTKDKINFLAAHKYVEQNVFSSIDQKTGRPTYFPERIPGKRGATTFCPSLWGGKDWIPEAYNPDTGLFYIPANNNLCAELLEPEADLKYTAGGLYIGYPIPDVLGSLRAGKNFSKGVGELQAWDLNTGKQVWMHSYKTFNWGPLMTTGGNLVFAGGTNDRMFRAFDAKTGAVLWEYPMPSGVTGVPTSYEVDGVQYVAVQSGWGVDAQRMQAGWDAITNTKTNVPQGGTVMVFKLKK